MFFSRHPLPQPAHVGHWTVGSNKGFLQMKRVPVSMKVCIYDTTRLAILFSIPRGHFSFTVQGPYRLQATKYPIERVESRGVGFSELRCHWMLPIHETNYIATICTGPGNHALYPTCFVHGSEVLWWPVTWLQVILLVTGGNIW